MFILAPVPDIHHVTGQSNGKKVSLLPIDFLSIESIDECTETNNAIITYKSGRKIITLMPFTKVLNIYAVQGIVLFDFTNEVSDISKPVAQYIKSITVK
jgi:hypothetical protein